MTAELWTAPAPEAEKQLTRPASVKLLQTTFLIAKRSTQPMVKISRVDEPRSREEVHPSAVAASSHAQPGPRWCGDKAVVPVDRHCLDQFSEMIDPFAGLLSAIAPSHPG